MERTRLMWFFGGFLAVMFGLPAWAWQLAKRKPVVIVPVPEGHVRTTFGIMPGCVECGVVPIAEDLLCEHGFTAAPEWGAKFPSIPYVQVLG